MARRKREPGGRRGGGAAEVRRLLRALKADEASLQDVVRELERVRDPWPVLVHVAALDEDEALSDLATLLLHRCAGPDGPVGPAARERVIRKIEALLADRRVKDLRKCALIRHLAQLGVTLEAEALSAHFDEPALLGRVLREELETRLEDHPAFALAALNAARATASTGWMQGTEWECTAAALAVVGHHVREQWPDVGALIAALAAVYAARHDAPTDMIEPAVDAIGVAKSGRSLWCLEELAVWPGASELAGLAAERAEALREEGIRPSAPPVGRFSHAWLTPCNALGRRTLVVLGRTDEGTYDGVALYLSDRVGIIDIATAFAEGADFDELARRRDPEGVRYAICDLERARETLADALFVHHETGSPPPAELLLVRPLLGPEPIEPAAQPPKLGAYLLETYIPGPDLARGTEELAEHSDYGALLFLSDAAYAFVDRLRSRRRGRARSRPPRRDVLVRFAREVEGDERATLILRLGRALEVAALEGRAADPVHRLAARAYLALTEGVVPFEENPYVLEMARRSIMDLEEQLAAGITNQDDLSAAIASHVASEEDDEDDEDEDEDDDPQHDPWQDDS